MRINGYRCDYCSAENLIGPIQSTLPDNMNIPVGWYAVGVAGLIMPSKMWTFCSQKCLHYWSEAKEEENDAVKDVEVAE